MELTTVDLNKEYLTPPVSTDLVLCMSDFQLNVGLFGHKHFRVGHLGLGCSSIGCLGRAFFSRVDVSDRFMLFI